MKILYAIQGTGNGHISRALEIIPILQKFGDLDLFVSGENCEVKLPQWVKHRSKGVSFFYSNNGGINYLRTLRKLRFLRASREVINFAVQQYDLVINDFEPISAFACKLKQVPLLALGHQAAFKSPNCPRPAKVSVFGEFLLKHYAPFSQGIGFHFHPYDHFVHTPVIRSQVRNLIISDQGHITVYLSAYNDEVLLSHLRLMPKFRFHIFSKKAKIAYDVANCRVIPVENEVFLKSLATCHGFLSGAGFEGPSEALFLQKKLMVIPIKGQYEQYCNGAALDKMGVPVLEKLSLQSLSAIENWINSSWNISVHYPDETEKIIAAALCPNNIVQSYRNVA
jgi:uncharacterized protein (TIGR00661 family)